MYQNVKNVFVEKILNPLVLFRIVPKLNINNKNAKEDYLLIIIFFSFQVYYISKKL